MLLALDYSIEGKGVVSGLRLTSAASVLYSILYTLYFTSGLRSTSAASMLSERRRPAEVGRPEIAFPRRPSHSREESRQTVWGNSRSCGGIIALRY